MRMFLSALALVATTAICQSPCFDTTYGTGIGSGDDTTLPLQPIGFSFPYAGSTYTDFYASTNGFIYLRNGAAATLPSALCCTGVPATMLANTAGPMVCIYWKDLNEVVANAGQVFVNSTASVCTITWFNCIEYAEATNTKFHLQMKLYPSGQIDFTYSSNVQMRTATNCVVGGSPGNAAADPGSSDLSLGGASAVDTVYQLFSGLGSCDLGGQTLTFIPASPGFAYVMAPCPLAIPPAFNSSYGLGCMRSFNSFYELFATSAAFDLAGTSMTLLYTGTGYVALPGTAAYVAPTGAATVLALTDDSQAAVALSTPFPIDGGTTSSLMVCSNGFVSKATGNLTGYTPTPATFLAMPQTVFSCLHDYNVAIAGSGQVKYEEVGNLSIVTWDGVLSFGTTAGADTFQFQFDRATGNVHYVWVTAAGVGNGKLIGYSPGGASQDPGSIDLSVYLPLVITVSSGPELIPLGLTATGTGSPGGTVTLTSTNVPATAPFGAVLFGLVKFLPGLPIPGTPSCFQYNEGAATSLFLSPATGASFTAPTGTAFLGINVQAQSAVFVPGINPLQIISSNGIEMTLGT